MSDTTSVQNRDAANIVVNGQTRALNSRDVTWDEAVDLAYPGDRSNPDLDFIVTYEDADQPKDDGTLAAGSSVHVKKDGTVLHVKKHRRS